MSPEIPLKIQSMNITPFSRCAKKRDGKFQCSETVAPGRRYCQKHYLVPTRLDERKWEGKLAGEGGGAPASTSGKDTRVLSAKARKRKMHSRSEGKRNVRMQKDEVVEVSHSEFLNGVVSSERKRARKDILFHGSKKRRSDSEGGKEVVQDKKTREKKRKYSGMGVKEPGRLNKNSSGLSLTEKSSSDKRKKKHVMSKFGDSGGLQGDAELEGMETKRLTCHQCMHSFEKIVICCTCKIKRYCYSCLAKWYPEQTKTDVEIACPFCRGNCNCKACLRVFLDLKVSRKEVDDTTRLQHLLYLMYRALPILKVLDEEHKLEIDVEARIQAIEADAVVIPRTKLENGERIYCDCCSTSIVDFHRSCSSCSYDLCLACCRELREGFQAGIKQSDSARRPVIVQIAGQVFKMNATADIPRKKYGWQGQIGLISNNYHIDDSSLSDWRANIDGSIPCPPKDCGGCGNGLLALKRSFKSNWVVKLINNAEKLTSSCHFVDDSASGICSSCPDNCSFTRVDQRSFALRRTASRESSHDNFLYCPSAIELEDDEYAHFQKHWRRGEPVIVKGIFYRTTGLSWDPMVMWRALRDKKIKNDNHAVKAVDCLDWCEVEINTHKFFRGYEEGRIHRNGWPEMLKLKDWPPSSLFAERLPRHYAEFIAALPYKEYTHPVAGIMNLATRIPKGRPNPDLGPKTYIAYGFDDELGRGDSVTKLHCDISDAVNVLTHTTKLTMSASQTERMKELQKKYDLEDFQEFSNALGEVTTPSKPKGHEVKSNLDQNCSSGVHHGGAVWDIFRREDVPKLNDYLQKHWKEFRHFDTLPLNSIVHPIHDQTLYLNERHKEQLKDEFNVEPWTFEQYLGEAVFIPAGCPHQVRNRQSCIKVALDFVSPENIGECVRLTEEFRLLPKTHRAKEDKLEVKKMALYAISSAVREATELISKGIMAEGR